MTQKQILLIAGGWSPEREISLKGALAIEKSLKKQGHNVHLFDLNLGFDALADACKNVDMAFINLHGAPGEDGLVQAFLEQLGCPYQGSSPKGSLLALHKEAAKALFNTVGLRTAKGIFISKMPTEDEIIALEKIPYPLFIKSNTGGSSLHLYRAKNRSELMTALQEILNIGQEALIEELIEGQELTCGVLGDKVLPPILIVPKGEFFDFANKYDGVNGADEICPAPISNELTKKIQDSALKAHNILGLQDYSRTDFIVTKTEQIYILEVNTLPGMTDTSLIPKAAKAIGMEFHDLLEHLIHSALQKNFNQYN